MMVNVNGQSEKKKEKNLPMNVTNKRTMKKWRKPGESKKSLSCVYNKDDEQREKESYRASFLWIINAIIINRNQKFDLMTKN